MTKDISNVRHAACWIFFLNEVVRHLSVSLFVVGLKVTKYVYTLGKKVHQIK